MVKKELYKFVMDYFQKSMPVAETELKYNNPYELLVAVILSAQCTDKRVNLTTPGFFKKYPSAEILAKANKEDVLAVIRSCTYPNVKAINLISMANMLIDKFNGEIPDDIELLQELPGVGRKTANVIASVIYNKPAMAVDTHVFRVAARIGLTEGSKTPLDTEKQLVANFPEDILPLAHHWLLLHGRYICIARNPKCNKCGLTDVCRYNNNSSKQKVLSSKS